MGVAKSGGAQAPNAFGLHGSRPRTSGNEEDGAVARDSNPACLAVVPRLRDEGGLGSLRSAASINLALGRALALEW